MKIKISRRNWIKLCTSALIPLMIGVFTIVTTVQQQKLSSLQREKDKEEALLLGEQSARQAEHLRKESVFTNYLDDISNLLTLDSEKNTLVRIRAKTLVTLRQLDSERKKHLLLFLYDIGLIYNSVEKSVDSLLSLNDADFSRVHFQGTTETRCSFMYLYLYDVYLSDASFISCYIDRSNFSASTMYRTNFFKARLYRISFKFPLLSGSNFDRTTFFEVNFLGTSLVECNFTNTTWRNQTVNFTNANLTRAILSDRQLSISVLDNAILPNGTWGPIKTVNLVMNSNAEQNNISVSSTNVTSWYISIAEKISIVAYEKWNFNSTFGKYHFRITPTYNLADAVSMSQNISFEKYTLLISSDMARYNVSVYFQCYGNQLLYLQLIFMDFNDLKYTSIYQDTMNLTQSGYLTVSNVLHFEIRQVQLKIGFFKDRRDTIVNQTTTKENYCIVDNIYFSIMKNK